MPKKVSITRGMASAMGRGRTKLVCQECGLHVPVYRGRYPKMCSSCGGELTPFQETEEGMEQLISKVLEGESAEEVVEVSLKDETFWPLPGDRVKIRPEGGLNRGKTGTVVQPGTIPTSGRGIPEVPGAYNPINPKEEVEIEFDDGTFDVVNKHTLTNEMLRHEQEETPPPVDTERGGILPSQSAVPDDRMLPKRDPGIDEVGLFGWRGMSIGDRVAVIEDTDDDRSTLGTISEITEDGAFMVALDGENSRRRKFFSYELSLVLPDTGILQTGEFAESVKHEGLEKVIELLLKDHGYDTFDFWFDRGMWARDSAAARDMAEIINKDPDIRGTIKPDPTKMDGDNIRLVWESVQQEFARMSFEDWLRKVDQAVGQIAGLSYMDLADQPYRDWYDDGVAPGTAAKRALASEGF